MTAREKRIKLAAELLPAGYTGKPIKHTLTVVVSDGKVRLIDGDRQVRVDSDDLRAALGGS